MNDGTSNSIFKLARILPHYLQCCNRLNLMGEEIADINKAIDAYPLCTMVDERRKRTVKWVLRTTQQQLPRLSYRKTVSIGLGS